MSGLSGPSGTEDIDLVLLDLDGPVVRLLPDPQHLRLAAAARRVARRHGPWPELDGLSDHVQVLRRVAEADRALAEQIEMLCAEAEDAAARRCPVRPDAARAVRQWVAEGRGVAVVSNNTLGAVRTVVRRAQLPPGVSAHGRAAGGWDRLKPAPDLLVEALQRHGVPATRAVMVGDSVSDVQAADAAGVRAIGWAQQAQRARELTRAGATEVVRCLEPWTLW